MTLAMTDTLTPVERTNWALSTWNSTLDRNDGPTAWLYDQDHLWTTQDLVSSPGELWPPPTPPTPSLPSPSLPSPPPTHPSPSNSGLKLKHTFEKIV